MIKGLLMGGIVAIFILIGSLIKKTKWQNMGNSIATITAVKSVKEHKTGTLFAKKYYDVEYAIEVDYKGEQVQSVFKTVVDEEPDINRNIGKKLDGYYEPGSGTYTYIGDHKEAAPAQESHKLETVPTNRESDAVSDKRSMGEAEKSVVPAQTEEREEREAPAVCPHCGKALPEGSKFCQYCGTRLNEAPANTVQQEKPPETIQPTKMNKEERSAEQPTRRRKNTTATAALILSLLLLVGNIYQYTVIQKLKHPVSETSNTMSAMSVEEEIEIWLEKHGNEYKRDKDFFADTNRVDVKVGDTRLITITKRGTFKVVAGSGDIRICTANWRPDLQVLSGVSTVMRIEVTGIKPGITQIEFDRQDTKEGFSILVHVLP